MYKDMTTEQYAKFVIDNMSRATLANALNITQYIDTEDNYSFAEFVNAVADYLCGKIPKMDRRGVLISADVLSVGNRYLKKYNSDKKYNKRQLIDNYIIGVWEAIGNGTKGS